MYGALLLLQSQGEEVFVERVQTALVGFLANQGALVWSHAQNALL